MAAWFEKEYTDIAWCLSRKRSETGKAVHRSLGADHVIDYTQEDFTQRSERYDLIFDVASNLSLSVCKPALTPTGIYVLIGHDQFGDAAGHIHYHHPIGAGGLGEASFNKIDSADRQWREEGVCE